MRAYSGKRAKNRPESAHFVSKSADFLFCNRSLVLTEPRREMRTGAIAAPPTVTSRARPARRKPRESRPFAQSLRKLFPKIRIYVILCSKAERKFARRQSEERDATRTRQ